MSKEQDSPEGVKIAFEKFRSCLLSAPADEIHPSVFPLLEKLSNPPKSVELLDLLIKCSGEDLMSSFSKELIGQLYVVICHMEGVTHEEVKAARGARDAGN